MICALWSIPNLSNHFTEIINPIKGITWVSAGKDVSEYLYKEHGIESSQVIAGVDPNLFYPTKKITNIKNIGLNGVPFVNSEWDKIKRPQMLVDIANGINGNPIFIHGKDLTLGHEMYNDIDMYICTSTNDRGPYGIAEAAFCKIPVLSTKTGFALKFKSIKTFDTVEEAVEIINELNQNPEKLNLYVEEVYAELTEYLNWTAVIEKYWIPIFEKHQKPKSENAYNVPDFITNFITNIEYLDLDSEVLKQRDSISEIPAKLHLIWVGNKQIPQHVIDNKNKWKDLMPHWDVILWTNDNLTEEYFDKEYLDFILSAPKAVQQADIMRVCIIKKYGGFYVDADIKPIRSLDDLLYIDNDMILCNDYPTNFPYISSSFFAATPNHPVMQMMYKDILNADLNDKNIHMQTGPSLLGRCVFMNNWENKYPAFLNLLAMYQSTSDVSQEFIDISNKIYKLKKSNKNSIDELDNLNKKYNELFFKVQNNKNNKVKHIKHPLRFGEHLYLKSWETDSFIHSKESHYDFIEIGTSDFYTLIETYPDKRGISIEPIPVYFNTLPKSDSVIKLNCAITSYDGKVEMNWIHPDDIKNNNLPNWLRGYNSIGDHFHRDKISSNFIRKSNVPCITWNTLIKRYNVNSVNLIKIDTEGHDYVILKQILEDCFTRNFRPKNIMFENNELTNAEEIEKIVKDFISIGYTYIKDFDSTLTYNG